MKNKRIVFFAGTLLQGGAERVISVLSRSFAEQGLDVSILCYYDSEIFYNIHPKVKLFSVEKETGTKNKIRNLLWMRKFFKQNADVIISFMAKFNMLAIFAHFGLKMPIIVADRSDPFVVPNNPLLRKLRDLLYNFADRVVLQTKRNYSYFSKSIQNKAEIIANPVDVGEFGGVALKTEKRQKIVSVGRLIPLKNQKMLIDAFAKVSEKYNDYTLTIYGDGSYRNDLENYINALSLSEKVLLPGNQKDIFSKIADAQLFVLSSNYEGMPNALIEAMCMGLPVISTDVSGAADFIENGVNGLIVECNNLEQMVSALDKMLGDNEFCKAAAENAVSVAAKVDTDTIAKKWFKVIEDII